MRALNSNPNVDNSDLSNYPDGRIKDNNGTSNGTGVNERVKGDMHQAIAKLMRLYAITPNGLPDNETNGFQIVEAFKSLASKNDYIYPLSSASGVLSVDIKFANMQNGEFIVCRASVDKASETQIKGFGATTFAITYSGSFKANEYVRVIKTSGGVSIVRLADATSLDAMVSDFLYLKKASQAQENAGAVDTVATTPLTNLVAFTRRVIGVDSGSFLAIATGVGERNGLLSKEDKKKLDDFDETVIGSGSVAVDGTKLTQRKITFTSSRISTGTYLITHNLGFSNYGVSGSSLRSDVGSIGNLSVAVYNRTNSNCILTCSDDGSPNDGEFAFILFRL